ncbi:hypothetical protein PoB_001814900 [Plakobranchus ocellatus]|uniref:Uncharacterized protein n=1 Tax=Plakobranchus ocellatus TaxID=259542 RepID=A0AAV3ZCL7_9GAST|nr:hypothetical protein PoB_001814900 [Plakobranchus ocellatus]
MDKDNSASGAPARGLVRIKMENHNSSWGTSVARGLVDVGNVAIEAEPIGVDLPVFLGRIERQLQGARPSMQDRKHGDLRSGGTEKHK